MRNQAQYATQYATQHAKYRKLIQKKLHCAGAYFKEGASKIRTILLVWLPNDLL